MTPTTTQPLAVCALCEDAAFLLDEHHRCERCVTDAERLASLLSEAEDTLTDALKLGLTPERAQEWLRMCLTGAEGMVPGMQVARRAGIWEVSPASAFDEDDGQVPSKIRRLRRASRLSLEELADELGVAAQELALWEQGGDIPCERTEQLASRFGVSVGHLKGEPPRGHLRWVDEDED